MPARSLDSFNGIDHMTNPSLLGSFLWCELMTTDTTAAGGFYKKVVGWKTKPWPHDASYTTFTTGAGPVAGMMILPAEAKQMGAPPNWMMYVGTPSVDDTAMRVAQLGGRVIKQPDNIPDGGRFAVVADPQGAVFGLFTPKAGQPTPAQREPATGDFSWYELYTTDLAAAWTFYSTLFGWEKTTAMDMGEMGVYQMFRRGEGVPGAGGMMKAPPGQPAAWLPYAMVPDAKAAAERAIASGGKIVNGPMEVPGGDWIAQGQDPQGAMFAVHSRKPAAAAAKPAAAKPAAAQAAPAKPAAAKAAPAKAAPAKPAPAKPAAAKKASAKKAAAPKKKAKAAKAAKPARKAAKKPAKKAAKKTAKRPAAKARGRRR
jgi:predicted enzyme related to lactoylglutathione lyase